MLSVDRCAYVAGQSLRVPKNPQMRWYAGTVSTCRPEVWNLALHVIFDSQEFASRKQTVVA
ncbi:hypothetical protein M406DRAFT_320325 [Cryphonectria parasitica EP155]|uniref:Uncharacterized protein n=1 Tax=Cryphonectria parasitica (strain ATCC 38755 / EP155) TaxID=660469 RepID=A0A9P4YC31_CRYP1|nr:uncharacterized protein M406DRAFT_320325 [Cryphonectria parasitica EP155]KAF3770320.1 hypothetical protein M406DRAFT_320325 [Cryphonectria parasitica EP155]